MAQTKRFNAALKLKVTSPAFIPDGQVISLWGPRLTAEWHDLMESLSSDLVITVSLAGTQHTGFACLASFEFLRASMFTTAWAFNYYDIVQILTVIFFCIIHNNSNNTVSSFRVFRISGRSTPRFNLGFRNSHALNI